MTKPRTPEFFPRMKVRGARRRRLAPYQRMRGQFSRLGFTAREALTAMETFSKILKRESNG